MKKKEATTPTTDKPEQKKGAKIALKIANIFINTLIVLVLIISIVIATLALTSKANDGVPSIFGYSFHTIMSPSMEGGSDKYDGGNYNVGDLVIGKATNKNPNEIFEVGDIIVFTTKNDNMPDGVDMIAHRVIEVNKTNAGVYEYTTQGDNNDTPDTNTHTAADIVAVTHDHDFDGAIFRGVGYALNYIRSSEGFFLVILLPMIIFFLYEIFRVVINALNYKKSKASEDKEDAEREKQAAVDAAVKAALAAVGKSTDDIPAEAKPAEDAPAEDAPAEDAPAEDAPAEDAPAEDAAVEDVPAEKTAAPEMSAEDYEEFKRFMAFKKAQEKKDS